MLLFNMCTCGPIYMYSTYVDIFLCITACHLLDKELILRILVVVRVTKTDVGKNLVLCVILEFGKQQYTSTSRTNLGETIFSIKNICSSMKKDLYLYKCSIDWQCHVNDVEWSFYLISQFYYTKNQIVL